MSIQKYYSRACLIVALLLSACGGGSPDAPPKVVNLDKSAYVYMAGDYVEGLTYSAKTLSGTTGPKGLFMYRVGEPVTFSIGNKRIGSYTPPAYPVNTVTHFSILGTNNPYDTAVVNLSVLLHFLDSDSGTNLNNGLTIGQDRLALANKVNEALTDSNYLAGLRVMAQNASPPQTVPNTNSVLAFAKAQTIVDKIQVPPYAAGNFVFNEFKSTLTLSALDSTDANGDSLTYKWSIDSKPKTSKAVIASPTLDTITVGIDADDEPYIFRVLVSDSVAAVPLTLTADVKKTNIAGVYTSGGLQTSERRVVAITDTAEVWGYTSSTANNVTTVRAFTGGIMFDNTNSKYKLALSASAVANTVCPQQCPAETWTAQLNSAQPNDPQPRTVTVQNGPDSNILQATALTDAPTLFTNMAGWYGELGSPAKKWGISKTTLSFYDTVTTTVGGKTTSTLTLCATGDMKTDANSQVLDANGAVTKFMIPIKIDFKAACNDGFDPNSSSTGVLMPDASLGLGGYTFIGKNPNQSYLFVRHFIRG
jgi:hypothetical protein